jgi:hypothetical protein
MFLHHTFVPHIRYLGFTLEIRRVPWLRRRTCSLASPNEIGYAYTPSTAEPPVEAPDHGKSSDRASH